MSYRGRELGIFEDFSGGQNSSAAPTGLPFNQATVFKNYIVMANGRGIRQRLGDTEFNSTAMNSSATVIALLYYRQADKDDFLMAIAGNAIFKSDALDGTMDDITGGATITAGNTNTWTPFVAEDEAIFVGGGSRHASQVDWKWRCGFSWWESSFW